MKKAFKYIILLSVFIVISMGLTGCGAVIRASCEDISDQFYARGQANKNIAEDMKNIGLINSDTYDQICTKINTNIQNLVNGITIPDGKSSINFNDTQYQQTIKSISALALPTPNYLNSVHSTTGLGDTRISDNNDDGSSHQTYEYGNSVGDSCSNYDMLFITAAMTKSGNKHIKTSKLLNGAVGTNDSERLNKTNSADWMIIRGGDITPVDLVPNTLDGNISLQDALQVPIYVLDNVQVSTKTDKDLEDVLGTVQALLNDDKLSNSEKVSRLTGNYFKKTDKCLVGNDTVNGILIGDSTGYGLNGYDHKDMANHLSNNRPGKDLVVTEHGYPMLTFRLHEFNYDAYKEFKERLTLGEDSIKILLGGGNNNACVILNYPVSSVETLETNPDGTLTGNLNRSTSTSYISLNIETGKMLKNIVTSSGTKVTTVKDIDDSYMIVLGKSENGASSRSSFDLTRGERTLTVNTITKNSRHSDDSDKWFNDSKSNIVIPEIVLIDYLETVYAPGYNASDDFVAFGRKIRLKNYTTSVDTSNENKGYLKWNLKNTSEIAGYVNILGDKTTEIGLDYSDIIDIPVYAEGYIDRYKVYIENDEDDPNSFEDKADELIPSGRILQLANYDNDISVDETPNHNNAKLRKVAEKISNENTAKALETWATTKINFSVTFPSKYIDKADNTSEFGDKSNQLFYAIGTNKTVFENDLFSGWINVSKSQEDKEKACLDWWVEWLQKNEYKYTLDHNALNTYLKNNYSFEFAKQSDIVVLDPEVLAQLQKDFDESHEKSQNLKINSIFKLIGWALVIYTIILTLAWVLDTILDIGIKLVNKLTFGKWEAVRYSSDIPNVDESNIKYVSLPVLLKSIIVMDTLAIILIVVPAFKLVAGFLSVFGKIAEFFDKAFSGIYR